MAKLGKAILFFGVNVNIGKLIQTQQDLACAQVLLSKSRWMISIIEHRWPYSIDNVAATMNYATIKYGSKSRAELLSDMDVQSNIKLHNHFGVPTDVLN
jgi:hypothetical protein